MSFKVNQANIDSLLNDMNTIMESAEHKALFVKEAEDKKERKPFGGYTYNASGDKGNKVQPPVPAPKEGYKPPTNASAVLDDLVKIADYLGNAGFITSEAITDNLINSIIVEAKTKAKKAKKELKKAKKLAKKEKKMAKLEEKEEKKAEKPCPEGDPTCE